MNIQERKEEYLNSSDGIRIELVDTGVPHISLGHDLLKFASTH